MLSAEKEAKFVIFERKKGKKKFGFVRSVFPQFFFLLSFVVHGKKQLFLPPSPTIEMRVLRQPVCATSKIQKYSYL